MVRASFCSSWLNWVWRSLSFFFSTFTPMMGMFSGFNEPDASTTMKNLLGLPA